MANPQNVVRPLREFPASWEDAIALFVAHQHSQNLAAKTIKDSLTVLRGLALATHTAPAAITTSDLLLGALQGGNDREPSRGTDRDHRTPAP